MHVVVTDSQPVLELRALLGFCLPAGILSLFKNARFCLAVFITLLDFEVVRESFLGQPRGV